MAEQYIYPQKSHYIQEVQDYIDYFLVVDEYKTASTVIHAELKTATQKPVIVPKDIKVTFQDCIFKQPVKLEGNNVVIFDRCTFYEKLEINAQCKVIIMGGGPEPAREYPDLYYDDLDELKRKMIKKSYPSEIHEKIIIKDSDLWVYDTEWFNSKGQTWITGSNSTIKIEGKHFPKQNIHMFQKLFNDIKNSKILVENFKFLQLKPMKLYNNIITLNNVDGKSPLDIMKKCQYNDIKIYNTKFESPMSFMKECENNYIIYRTTTFGDDGSEYFDINDSNGKIEKSKYFDILDYDYTYNLKSPSTSPYLDASALNVNKYIFDNCTINTVEFSYVVFGKPMLKYWKDDCTYNFFTIHKCKFLPFLQTTKGSNNKLIQKYTSVKCAMTLFEPIKSEFTFDNCTFEPNPMSQFKGIENIFVLTNCNISPTTLDVFNVSYSSISLNNTNINNSALNIFNTTNTEMNIRDCSLNNVGINVFIGSNNNTQLLNTSINNIGTDVINTTNSSYSMYKTTMSAIGVNVINGTSNNITMYKSNASVIGQSFLNGTKQKLTIKKSTVSANTFGYSGSEHHIISNDNKINSISKHFNALSSTIIEDEGTTYDIAPTSDTNECDVYFERVIFNLLTTFTQTNDKIVNKSVSYPLLTTYNTTTCQMINTNNTYMGTTTHNINGCSAIIQNQTGIKTVSITNGSGVLYFNTSGIDTSTITGSRMDLFSTSISSIDCGNETITASQGVFANGEFWIGSPTLNLQGDTFVKLEHNLTIEKGNLRILDGDILINGDMLQTGNIASTGNLMSLGQIYGNNGLFTNLPSQKKPSHTH